MTLHPCRRARQGLSTASYAGLVYGAAGLLLLPLAALSADSLLPTSPRDLLVWLGLVLVPTLGGHTVFNWALRYVQASIISGTILAEPVVVADEQVGLDAVQEVDVAQWRLAVGGQR